MKSNKLILNLSESDNTKYVDYQELTYDFFKFPSGEQHIRLNLPKELDEVIVILKYREDGNLIKLFLATDALREFNPKMVIHLYLPFIPFARQDRVTEVGECFSLKTFAKLLNAQNYDSVTVLDPHSDVATALINNVRVITNHELVKWVGLEKSVKLVFPDAGSAKKVAKLVKFLNHGYDIVVCNKSRDTVTGNITGITIPMQFKLGCTYFIIDDICDGGKTFIEIAKVIDREDPLSSVNLIVTHGLFSKGVENLFLNKIQNIYTTDSCKEPTVLAEHHSRFHLYTQRLPYE